MLSAINVGFDGLLRLPTFMFYLVPSITVTLALFIGVKNKEYLVRVLKKMSMKIAVSIVMIALPLMYLAAFWQLWVPFWS